MKLTYLTIYLVKGTQVLQTHWKSSYYCNGPPSSMYIHNISDIFAYEPLENEVWPIFYQNQVKDLPLGICGNANGIEFYTNCCVSSLNKSNTGGYENANNVDYCYVNPNTTDLTPILFNHMYFIADGTCIDGQYKCLPKGEFVIYSGYGCTEEYESYQLMSDVTPHENELIGYFNAHMWKTSKAENQRIWITYYPFSAMVPNTTALADILTHICQVIFVGTVLLQLYYSGNQYRQKRHRFWLNLFFLNVFRLILRGVHIIYWFFALFCWNLLPAVFVPISLDLNTNRDHSFFTSIKLIIGLDKIYSFSIMLHALIIVGYIVIGRLIDTTVPGDDKVSFLMMHLQRTLLGSHEILATVSLSRLRLILPRIVSNGVSKLDQASQLQSKKSTFGQEGNT
ncbi:hypothetical protein BC833DRAFT_605543 [Globomyces pollinis-pini]|nr:hypothetical protein BC833DRAFT_605543 [Globomyces pollinis-pini]